jgi:hypothetical protein
MEKINLYTCMKRYPVQYRYFQTSIERMARLLECRAPNVILVSEAKIILCAYHGGVWHAVADLVKEELHRIVSNAAFTAETWFYMLQSYPHDQAVDMVVDRVLRKEAKREKSATANSGSNEAL